MVAMAALGAAAPAQEQMIVNGYMNPQVARDMANGGGMVAVGVYR